MKQLDITSMIVNRWNANNSTVHLVTDEPYRIQRAIQEASHAMAKVHNLDVKVWCHDKVCGFYQGVPKTRPPEDKTNFLAMALPLMVESAEQIKQAAPKMITPFNPADDIIFVLKDPNWDLNTSPSSPSVIQILRNVIQSNMCSGLFHGQDENGKKIRGKRMIVMVTSTSKLPEDLPEVKPITVPLPDEGILEQAVVNSLDRMVGVTIKKTGKKMPKLDGDQRRRVIQAGLGLTYQQYEESLSLALVENDGWDNIDSFLNTIEKRKGQTIAATAGLTYIPKDHIKMDNMPGYEEAVAFIKSRMSVPIVEIQKRDLQTLRGFTLVGMPGTGKTVFAMLAAKLMQRPLILWNLGETQEGLVGASERNARRAIQAIQSLAAVALVDDVDKAGLGAAASGHTGDGGTFGRIVQSLLTEMSGPDNQAVWIFTANRIANVPGELIRAGRMDERFVVDRPDEATRLSIMKVHLTRLMMTVDNEKTLAKLAGTPTEGFVGAELADLVLQGMYEALSTGTSVISTEWMLNRVKDTVPMSAMAVYAQDLQQMSADASQFRHIGRAPVGTAKPGTFNTGRDITI